MSMWEPFTDRARIAIVRSQDAASADGGKVIRPDHIVRGISSVADDPVAEVLARFLDIDALAKRSAGNIEGAPSDAITFSPESKKIIEDAFVHARRLNHPFIDTGHLALGIFFPQQPPSLSSMFTEVSQLVELRAALEESLSNYVASKINGTWKFRVAGEDFVAAPGLPLFLAADTGLQAAGIDSARFPNGTAVRIEITEPGKTGPTFIDLRLE